MAVERCPPCGSGGDFSLLHQLGPYAVFVCPSCKSGVTSPVPDQDELRAVNEAMYSVAGQVRERFARRAELSQRSAPLLQWARMHGQVDSAVDVGCHLGFLLADLRDLGVATLAGVELNSHLRAWSSDHLSLAVAPRCGDLPQASWDLVTMLDVLEHSPRPDQLLAEARDLVRPDGLVLLQMPNRLSEMARLAGRRWSWWSVPDHLVHFTPSGLERLGRRTGLAPIEIQTGDFVPDYLADVIPLVPSALSQKLRSFAIGRRFYRRRRSAGGLIRGLFRRVG